MLWPFTGTDHAVNPFQRNESAGHGVCDECARQIVVHDLYRGQPGALIVRAGLAGIDVLKGTDLMQAPHNTCKGLCTVRDWEER